MFYTKLNSWWVFAVLFSAGILQQHGYAQNYPYSDPNNTLGWSLIDNLSDEFEGNEIDYNKWWVQGHSQNGEDPYHSEWAGRPPSMYISDNVYVSDGLLTIKTKWDENYDFGGRSHYGERYGSPAPITTGAIISKNRFTYGYMEIRCKAADGPISSSFWTTGPQSELDVFESYGRNPYKPNAATRYHTSFHDWRPGSTNQTGNRIWSNDNQLEFNVAEDFHVYGLEWDPNYIKIYFDGRLVNCISKEELDNTPNLSGLTRWVMKPDQKVWLDSETFYWEVANSLLKKSDFGVDGVYFLTDYVRIWQKNTPSTGCDYGTNLLENSNFESGNLNGWSGNGEITTEAYLGNYAAKLSTFGTLEQTVTVKPNTKYMLVANGRSPGTNKSDIWEDAYLGVKDHGGAIRSTNFFMPEFYDKGVMITTGPNATEATIFFTNNPEGGEAIIDEIRFFESPSASNCDTRVESISLNTTSLNILQRTGGNLNATVFPSDACNKGITWLSGNSDIAVVDGVGKVTAVGAGSTTITAISQDNNTINATATVQVTPNYNLLNNGGFETGSYSGWWQNFGNYFIEENTAYTFEGDYAARVEGLASIGQTMVVEPETKYLVSLWAKWDNLDNAKPFYYIPNDFSWGTWGRPITPDEAVETAANGWYRFETELVTGANDGRNYDYTDTLSIWNSSDNQMLWVDAVEWKIVDTDTISETGISLDQTVFSVDRNATTQLIATIAPSNATFKSVTWSSSNPAIASVDDTGLVSGITQGTAIITATTDHLGLAATAHVTVTQNTYAVTGISINQSNQSLEIGTSLTLTASITPANASNTVISWSSNNNNVATINATTGQLSVVGIGTAYITATTQDGGFTDMIMVTVNETSLLDNAGFENGDLSGWVASYGGNQVESTASHIGDFGATINNSAVQQVVTLKANTTYKLSAYGKSAVSGTSVYLGVSNRTKAEFIANYEFSQTTYTQGQITFTTGNAVEEYTVWFWSNVAGSCDEFILAEDIDCSNCPPREIPVHAVVIPDTPPTLYVGDTYQFNVDISPSNASNKNVSWQVSNTNLATINNNGLLTALNSGNVTISVTTEDHGYIDSIVVTILEPTVDCSGSGWVSVSGVTLAPSNTTLTVNEQTQLAYNILPACASNQNVTYRSSDYRVATINSSGVVTAKGVGNAVITVVTKHLGKTAECMVTVINGNSRLNAIENSNSVLSNIQVYPQPASNILNIKWNENVGIAEFELLELSGKSVLKSNTSQEDHQIDISGLKGGIYLLKTQNNYHTEIRKVMIK